MPKNLVINGKEGYYKIRSPYVTQIDLGGTEIESLELRDFPKLELLILSHCEKLRKDRITIENCPANLEIFDYKIQQSPYYYFQKSLKFSSPFVIILLLLALAFFNKKLFFNKKKKKKN